MNRIELFQVISIISVISLIVIAFVFILFISIPEYEQRVLGVEGLTCDKLLDEIKGEYSRDWNVVLIDTWIEKECWR